MSIKIFVTEGTNNVNNYRDAINLAESKLKDFDAVKDGFSEACIEREKEFPTGLQLINNVGIAIPHGNSKLVKTSSISFVRLVKTVNFGLMEDASQKVACKFLFNLALTEGNQQLNALRKLMKLFQSEKFITDISNLPIDQLEIYLTNNLNEEI